MLFVLFVFTHECGSDAINNLQTNSVQSCQICQCSFFFLSHQQTLQAPKATIISLLEIVLLPSKWRNVSLGHFKRNNPLNKCLFLARGLESISLKTGRLHMLTILIQFTAWCSLCWRRKMMSSLCSRSACFVRKSEPKSKDSGHLPWNLWPKYLYLCNNQG